MNYSFEYLLLFIAIGYFYTGEYSGGCKTILA